MNVLQKQQVVKIFNRLFNEADTTNMSAKRIEEISEAIDLVKNLHIPVVGVTCCECKGSGGIRMDGTCARCGKPLELADE